jgi:hypothetical protein
LMIGRNGSSVSDFAADMESNLRISSDFQQSYVKKLENHADTLMDSKDHDAAIGCYSSALSLGPTDISDIIVKCCKARAGLLKEELSSATEV